MRGDRLGESGLERLQQTGQFIGIQMAREPGVADHVCEADKQLSCGASRFVCAMQCGRQMALPRVVLQRRQGRDRLRGGVRAGLGGRIVTFGRDASTHLASQQVCLPLGQAGHGLPQGAGRGDLALLAGRRRAAQRREGPDSGDVGVGERDLVVAVRGREAECHP
ncbi:Uncharacterised protein [Mycobacteroides abscessus subsp. massiliense]|nr:Uncharacterised protein [Mycobacteroides abscessus subsp. massiliense]